MAQSDSHKIGQMVGEWFEKTVVLKILESIVTVSLSNHSTRLFLDKIGPRQTRRGLKKVKWNDDFGASHDLDYVIEIDGSDTDQGYPIAFIEAAWRRYTKHSKAKAQEIQGAVLPVSNSEDHSHIPPFLGAVISGEWTQPAISQLEGAGFVVLRFTERDIFDLFSSKGVNIEWDERTTVDDLATKLQTFDNLTDTQLNTYADDFIRLHTAFINPFIDAIVSSITKEPIECDFNGGISREVSLNSINGPLAVQLSSMNLNNASIVDFGWSVSIKYSDDKIGTKFVNNQIEAVDLLTNVQTTLL